jgi:hypothetical protein
MQPRATLRTTMAVVAAAAAAAAASPNQHRVCTRTITLIHYNKWFIQKGVGNPIQEPTKGSLGVRPTCTRRST